MSRQGGIYSWGTKGWTNQYGHILKEESSSIGSYSPKRDLSLSIEFADNNYARTMRENKRDQSYMWLNMSMKYRIEKLIKDHCE